MTWYVISDPDINGKVYIDDVENKKAFNGYDFTGMPIWEDYGGDAYWMDPEEADEIIMDLEAAE